MKKFSIFLFFFFFLDDMLYLCCNLMYSLNWHCCLKFQPRQPKDPHQAFFLLCYPSLLCAGTSCIAVQQSHIREQLQSETNHLMTIFVRLADTTESLILLPHEVATMLMPAKTEAAQIRNPEAWEWTMSCSCSTS